MSPLGSASCTAGALATLEQRLAEELSASVGSLLPVPQDGGADDAEDPLKDLKQDLRGLRGRMAIVETVRAGWGEGASAGPARDLVPHRVGASPPQSIGALREQLRADVLEACGIPGGLVSTRSDGTGRREDYRRLAHGNLIPQSRIWATEISQKLNVPPPVFDLSAMYASDQVGRVAAFSKLVQSGVSIADASVQAGILGNE